MAKSLSKYGFVECADLVNEQRYGAALKMFQRAVTKFLESKISPKRSEIALQLLQIGTALEETLTHAYGAKWDQHIPKFSEKEKEASCSFCGKGAKDVGKLIAGPSVHICIECVNLCNDIVSHETEDGDAASVSKTASGKSKEDRLCGICMEARETDELIFLPHAAYMCAGCLEDIQTVRDKQTAK